MHAEGRPGEQASPEGSGGEWGAQLDMEGGQLGRVVDPGCTDFLILLKLDNAETNTEAQEPGPS